MALVIGGKTYGVPGTPGVSFVEAPGLALRPQDWHPRRRGAWVRGICLHTRIGLPVVEVPGAGASKGWDRAVCRFHAGASCHVVIDADGSFTCLADLETMTAYHAGHLDEISVGVELYQEYPSGHVWSATLRTCVMVCDVITRVLGIQRQYVQADHILRRFAVPTRGRSRASELAYVHGGGRGRDWCGLYGHRNVTRGRGPGDPGAQAWGYLAEAGYEGFAADDGDDLDVWAERQERLGVEPDHCDGIPGPLTRARIVASGRNEHGLWVSRPGDRTMTGA